MSIRKGDAIVFLLQSIASIGIGALWAAQACAAETADATVGANEAALQEIVVTATKRDTSIQKVPISMGTVSGAVLADEGITNFETLYVPDVQVPRGTMSESIYVRGVGSGTGLGFEQSAPLFMDGLYFGRSTGIRAAFFDVDQIEVVKGPEPTYLGKNATAGAVSVDWAKPTESLESYINTFHEFNYQETGVTAAVSGPLTDTLRARVAYDYRGLDEGWVKDTATGSDMPVLEDDAVRGTLLWQPQQDFTTTAVGWYTHDVQDGRNEETSYCPASGGPLNAPSKYPQSCTLNLTSQVYANPTAGPPVVGYGNNSAFGLGQSHADYDQFRMYGASLAEKWQAGAGITVSALTGYYEYQDLLWNEFDAVPINALNAESATNLNQFSQELRIQSSDNQRLAWMAGVYYDSMHTRQTDGYELYAATLFGNTHYGPNEFSYVDNIEADKSYAGFGQITYTFSDNWHLIVGGRYTDIEKNIVKKMCESNPGTEDCVFTPGFAVLTRSDTYSHFTPGITLQNNVTADIMAYASWKTGFKSGGYDYSLAKPNPNELAFKPETVNSYEIGAKSRLFDGSLILNADVFYANYNDLQVSSLIPDTAQFEVTNAARETTRGLEFDARWAVSHEITLEVDGSYLNARYDSFPTAECYPGQTAAEGCISGTSQDLAGQHTLYAPTWSGTFSADWRHSLSSHLVVLGNLSAFTTSYFQSNADNNPESIQPGFYKLDARVGLGSEDRAWDVQFVGRNLNNKLTCSTRDEIPYSDGLNMQGQVVSGITCLVDRPRTLAIEAKYRFGH